ncbi:MAG: molecular chaperone TorD family protein [Acidimicrobiia bacterium]|nr:molecular chaperone TorD family protein [Acidimicrobiia bacterium]
MTVGADAHRAGGAARAGLYARLAGLLTFPTAETAGACARGEVAAELEAMVAALPYALALDAGALGAPVDPEELGREFMRLFDVPLDGPPIPLYGGLYGGDRRQVMEELLRFYRHFGLSTAHAPDQDLPDAIPTVLEFLAFLVQQEAVASGPAAAPLRAAQRDVLERHLTRWTPTIVERLARKDPLPFYRVLVDLLHGFAAAERAALA